MHPTPQENWQIAISNKNTICLNNFYIHTYLPYCVLPPLILKKVMYFIPPHAQKCWCWLYRHKLTLLLTDPLMIPQMLMVEMLKLNIFNFYGSSIKQKAVTSPLLYPAGQKMRPSDNCKQLSHLILEYFPKSHFRNEWFLLELTCHLQTLYCSGDLYWLICVMKTNEVIEHHHPNHLLLCQEHVALSLEQETIIHV